MTRKTKDVEIDTTDRDIAIAENEGMIIHDTIEVTDVTVTEQEIIPDPATEHTVDAGDIRKKSSFGKTMYYIDPARVRDTKGPGQLLGMVKFMIEKGMTSPDTAEQGSVIGTRAVAEGYVSTNKLTGAVIFAYYIRRMEAKFGVEHAKTIHAKTGKVMN